MYPIYRVVHRINNTSPHLTSQIDDLVIIANHLMMGMTTHATTFRVAISETPHRFSVGYANIQPTAKL
jgi:hypothetical protein